MVEFSIKDNQYSVLRPKIQKWLSIEKIRSNIIESAGEKDTRFITEIYHLLSALLNIPDEELVDAPWYEIIEAYHLSAIECSPKLDLSILTSGKKERDKTLPDPWDYEERLWYSWLHRLAKNYGWTVEYISELDVDDAMALVQEISLDEQFEKEWEWATFEYAYKFDKKGKGELRKLQRPEWMSRANKSFVKTLEKPRPPLRPLPPSWIPSGVILIDGQPNNTFESERDSNTT